MRVLSLFDGMACGAITFTNLGLPIDRYVAYEIDKYAIQVATHNFPYIEQRGDVFAADFTEFNGFDWLIGGSPCTYWSIAQKNNRETEASGLGWELFSQYVRALHEAKPKYFLYENNKSMSKEIRASIDKAFGFEAVGINSALVSAQNRQRLYWVGIRQTDGTYRKADIEQPADRGILLRDVLDNAYPYRQTDSKKGYCLDANYWKTPGSPETFLEGGHARANRTMAAEPVRVAQRGRYADTGKRCVKGNGPVEQFYEAREDGKKNAITTVQKDNAVAEPVRVGTYPNESKNQQFDSKQYRIYDIDGKSTTICGQGGGMGAKTGLYAVPHEQGNARYLLKNLKYENEKTGTLTACCYKGIGADGMYTVAEKADGKQFPIYEVNNGLITIKDKQYPIKLQDGYYIIRKLTVSECKRLQTVPEWYDMSVISNSQAYKCLGNGWTVDVIQHLVKSALGVAYEPHQTAS